ncbi:MAG: stimulus-sensing domain-containing protein [Maricaulaceae bacterium]
MASDINIKKADKLYQRFKLKDRRRGPRRSIFFSRLSRLIIISNLIGLFILVAGSLAMNEFARSYLDAKMENLTTQAELVTSILGDEATGYSSTAALDVVQTQEIIGRIELPEGWRIRVHDVNSRVVADSAELDDKIEISELAPIGGAEAKTALPKQSLSFIKRVDNWIENLPWQKSRRDDNRRNINREVNMALSGQVARMTSYNNDDVLMASVSIPIRRVQKILGSLTIETDEVAQVISKERQALLPFIGLAILAAILSSMVLTLFIVKPIRQLAQAAERVTRSSEKRNTIPDLSDRKDEIGDLSLVMGEMTRGLYDRVDDIAHFAADVAHEIKNPLTSIRSASDTLRVAKTDEQRGKLIDIIQNDVQRMNRLISDISQASRVDAALAKEEAQMLDLNIVLAGICELYAPIMAEKNIKIEKSVLDAPAYIRAYEASFAQVLRNLIDNAMTFSSQKGTIFLKLVTDDKRVQIYVEDEGPGIPAESIETVFERFYTERPKGAVFGSHSGLGLAICRQIVGAHNGTIWAENRERGGARFIVELPLQTVEGPLSGRSHR